MLRCLRNHAVRLATEDKASTHYETLATYTAMQ